MYLTKAGTPPGGEPKTPQGGFGRNKYRFFGPIAVTLRHQPWFSRQLSPTGDQGEAPLGDQWAGNRPAPARFHSTSAIVPFAAYPFFLQCEELRLPTVRFV